MQLKIMVLVVVIRIILSNICLISANYLSWVKH